MLLEATLLEKVAAAPHAAGCYLFYDGAGNIIYVGKSKQLHQRVRSYFTKSAEYDERIEKLVREIRDVSYIVADTELDALIQEYMLIKRHKPWFNSQHIRDQIPVYLSIDFSQPFPSISMTQTPHLLPLFTGPYKDEYKAQDALMLLNATWKTPMCGKSHWDTNHRPCVYNEMQKCFAPCRGILAIGEGKALREEMEAFFAGVPEPTYQRIEGEMREAAASMKFEEAQGYKDTLEKIKQLQKRIEFGFQLNESTNALLIMKGYHEDACSVFLFEEGHIRNKIDFPAGTSHENAISRIMQACETDDSASFTDPLWNACLSEIHAKKRYANIARPMDLHSIEGAFRAFPLP